MDPLKVISVGIITLWLMFMGLNATGKLKFGKERMPKSWLSYVAIGVMLLVVIDYSFSQLEEGLVRWVYPLFLLHIVIFNCAIVFDWYSKTQIVNRIEHVFGSFIIMLFVYSLIIGLPLYPDDATKVSILIASGGIAAMLSMTNEVFELLLDKIFGTSEVGPDKYDTNWDIFMNLIGFGLFLVIAYIFNIG